MEEKRICPVCNLEIQPEEECTSCPDCGANYHVGCWQAQGVCSVCGNKKEEVAQSEGQFCGQCGAELAEGQHFCSNCGHAVGASAIQTDAQKKRKFRKTKSSKKKKWYIIGAVVLVLIVIRLLFSGGSGKNFKRMYGSSYGNEVWCTVASDGSWMEIDTNPDNMDDDDFDWDYYSKIFNPSKLAIQEINEDLGFSSAVYQKMTTTTAMQGRQTERNENYTVSWTYHPDNGLEILYERN